MNTNDLEKSEYIKDKQNLLHFKKTNKIQDEYSTIENEYLSALCFNETLIVVNEKEEEIGEFRGKIRTKNSSINNSTIMISLNSTSESTHNEKIGMSIITTTTPDFHSYEEKWSQWHSNKTASTSKKIIISKKNIIEPILLYTGSNNKELIDQTKNINLKYIANLLTEGMNYAFLRYIAIIGYEGSIKNKTAVTIDGILCKTVYECTSKEKYKINNTYIPVIIIKRILKADKSLKTPAIEITTVLTRLGYILKHSWGKTISEELKIKKSMRITKDGFVFNDTIIHLKENWDQDIRFKSMYLDKVLEMKIKYENYIKNNREVKDMIISYIKEILVTKPDNVLKFSINYFKEFN